MSERLENCPPKEAEDAAGEYYRCVKRDPPIGVDFESAEEQGRYPDADPCMRKAVSLFRDVESAEHQLRLFRGWKSKFIARGHLSGHHGKTLATGRPTHTSWWTPLVPDERALLFSVVSDKGNQ